MSGKYRKFWGFRERVTEASGDAPDIAVAPRPSWLLGAMVVVSTLGLIATSDEKPPQFRFESAVEGRRATLSSAAPSAKFLLTVRVKALGPGNSDTSRRADVTVHGKISTVLAPTGGNPFVDVRLSAGTGARSLLSALTQFDVATELKFEGDCSQPSDAVPCQATVVLELMRNDAGARGGVLNVDWSATFAGSADKDAAPDEGPAAPPWTIEVTAQ